MKMKAERKKKISLSASIMAALSSSLGNPSMSDLSASWLWYVFGPVA